MKPGRATAPLQAPGLRRRLACFVYEGVLLFGVVMLTGLLYGLLTQQKHGLVGMHGLQLALFAVLGLYFGWFWSHGGQTLAMKTWHIRVLTLDGAPLSPLRALWRYLLSWMWFLPTLALAHAAGLQSGRSIGAALAIGVVFYAGFVRMNAQHQYLHDLLAGTRLVVWKAPARARG
jgi:uncharacterized RDD family membrane protein YckC